LPSLRASQASPASSGPRKPAWSARPWFTPLLKAFVGAIIGGFGSITGALLGGYLLVRWRILIVAFLPSSVSPYRDAIVFALLIAFLLSGPTAS